MAAAYDGGGNRIFQKSIKEVTEYIKVKGIAQAVGVSIISSAASASTQKFVEVNMTNIMVEDAPYKNAFIEATQPEVLLPAMLIGGVTTALTYNPNTIVTRGQYNLYKKNIAENAKKITCDSSDTANKILVDNIDDTADDIVNSVSGKNNLVVIDAVDDMADDAVNGIKGGSNSWVRNLDNTSDLNVDDFLSLKDNGVVKVNTSGSDRPLTGTPNSYYKTGNGEHIFVYDGDGKLIYDISSSRVKGFKINVDPNGVEHYQAYKLEGAVPDAIKELFGW